MKDIWFWSDTHFNHVNILKFTKDDGTPIRPGYQDVDEMNWKLVHSWNKVVKPQDHVYHLGDVYMGSQEVALNILRSLNGHKRLILGNHDNAAERPINLCFQKILLWRIFKEFNFLCSHFPLPPEIMRKVHFNLHGHIHEKLSPDPRHINACVEHRQFPMHLDEVLAIIKERS